jgi:hypothetical protein
MVNNVLYVLPTVELNAFGILRSSQANRRFRALLRLSMIRGVGDIAVDAASIHAARSLPPRLYSLSGKCGFCGLLSKSEPTS